LVGKPEGNKSLDLKQGVRVWTGFI